MQLLYLLLLVTFPLLFLLLRFILWKKFWHKNWKLNKRQIQLLRIKNIILIFFYVSAALSIFSPIGRVLLILSLVTLILYNVLSFNQNIKYFLWFKTSDTSSKIYRIFFIAVMLVGILLLLFFWAK